MQIKMKATKAFGATEGEFRKGEIFFVEDLKRAEDIASTRKAVIVSDEKKDEPKADVEAAPENKAIEPPENKIDSKAAIPGKKKHRRRR